MQSKNAIAAVHAMASMQDMHIMCALFGTWVNTRNFYMRPPTHAEIKMNMEELPRYIIWTRGGATIKQAHTCLRESHMT